MSWNQAQAQILTNITAGLKLDPSSAYRTVTQAIPYTCNSTDFRGELGYKIQIGKESHIELPLKMLQTVYEKAVSNNGIYTREVICEDFAKQVKAHGCHVHVVGHLLVKAGLAEKVSKKVYKIL